MLTLVDNAVPARLREVYLRLRARDPATDVIVDVRRLVELPPGATVIVALDPAIDDDDLEWLNFNRPIVADQRHNVVLWCEDGAAARLVRHAPDFFDWISARVDCPPAPAAHAVAGVKAAIRERADGIAWDGPGLEETLAAVRPGRAIRRVAVASYQSMIDALTSRERGWLFLEGIDNDFLLRRLGWAMAEAGRRTIVFRCSFATTAPGWRVVHARHVSITEAVQTLATAGGPGWLAALTGLDPEVCVYVRTALAKGVTAAQLGEQLANARAPRDLLASDQASGAPAMAHQMPARDPVTEKLRACPEDPESWVEIAAIADDAGDLEVSIRWLTAAVRWLPEEADPARIARVRTAYGIGLSNAGEVARARIELERALEAARLAADVFAIARATAGLATVLQEQSELARARSYVEAMLPPTNTTLGESIESAALLETLADVLKAQGHLDEAQRRLEQAIAIKSRVLGTMDHPAIAVSQRALGRVLAARGDLVGARSLLERALSTQERLLGLEHPQVTASLRALAMVHKAHDDEPGAQALFERAQRIERVLSGSAIHLRIAEVIGQLALVSFGAGDLEKAQERLERSLALQHQVLGNDRSLMAASTRRNLARVLRAKGDLDGAHTQLEVALHIQREILGTEEHHEVAATLSDFGELQWQRGRLSEARELLEHAFRIQGRVLGRQHPDTAVTELTLAVILVEQGFAEDALAAARHAHAVLASVLGEAHARTVRAANVVEELSRLASPP